MINIQCPSSDDQYYKKFTFPAGEQHLILDKSLLKWKDPVSIEFCFAGSESVFELLLLSHTLWINGIQIKKLILPYMPFGQADRINEPGECFSLELFCLLVNKIVAAEIVVYDPHSDVTPALLDNCTVIHQWEIIAPIIKQIYSNTKNSFFLVCPDAGAEKKCHKLAKEIDPIDIIYCRKKRCIHTGKITGTQVGVNTN